MKLMFPRLPIFGSLCVLMLASLALSPAAAAQSKRNTQSQKASAKKTDTRSKDAKKDRDDKRTAAKDKKDEKNKREKLTAKAKEKQKADDKNKARSKDKDREARSAKAEKADKKESRAESKRFEAERRRQAEERRQAMFAEMRRREAAAREARERKLAFERGLRTETVRNIAMDRTEGEDIAIRNAAINALGSHAGSVVVMEAQTGKVLTIVNQDWAIRDSVKPCSTIKLVTGVAGINEGVIDKADGSVRNASTRRRLDDALAYSDNPYFQRAGSIVGNPKMVDYARKMGLGEPTGINAEGETAGRLAVGNNNARIYSHGDDFEVSTVQLAVMVSAITNGGVRVIPRTPRTAVEKTNFQPFMRKRVDVPQQNLRRVIPGMMGAAEYGTARRNMDQTLGVAGKTGSCISKGSWVGLFASVAPIEQPKYAVAVITRGQAERGKKAAAIAGDIYRALSRQIVRGDRNLAQTEFKVQPKPVRQLPLPIVDEEEDSDMDDMTASGIGTGVVERREATSRPVIVVPSAPRTEPRKLVTKTGSSKPTFPPVVITYDRDGRTD